jgi:hypothetical protein
MVWGGLELGDGALSVAMHVTSVVPTGKVSSGMWTDPERATLFTSVMDMPLATIGAVHVTVGVSTLSVPEREKAVNVTTASCFPSSANAVTRLLPEADLSSRVGAWTSVKFWGEWEGFGAHLACVLSARSLPLLLQRWPRPPPSTAVNRTQN